MIPRKKHLQNIRSRLRENPVVALLGPRQTGKTTLAKEISCDLYLDLENPRDLARLEDPLTTFAPIRGLAVIDEIQRRPELFPVIRVLVDEKPGRRFLILGSASPNLIRQTSESLAGRISFYELDGFSLYELGYEKLLKLWVRGSFPRSFLARTEQASFRWRQDFVTTFLERDIPQLGIEIPSNTLRRFWTMLAHYHGQLLQYSELARSLGVSDMTIRRYLDILEGTYMVQVIRPWSENIGKRVVKQPKIYLSDSGILHTMMDINSIKELQSHPKIGASWEGFVLQQIGRLLRRKNRRVYFWRTHAGAELDFFWEDSGHRYGIEVKYSLAPGVTPSMRSSLIDLGLKRLMVVYPGKESYQLTPKIEVTSLPGLFKILI